MSDIPFDDQKYLCLFLRAHRIKVQRRMILYQRSL